MDHVRRHSTVPGDLAGMRLDRAAAVLFGEFSRAMLSQWIRQGDLKVDGAVVKPRLKLAGGERLELVAELTPREDWTAAESVVFRVVHEDAALLVVDKPPGVVVHPGAGNPRGTLVNGLLHDYPELSQLPRAGIVHRLDKDTSGLLLVARTLESRHYLVKLLARRAISRRYLAVVEGLPGPSRDIEAPIGRDPRRRTRQAVRADGRPALTRIRRREAFRAHALVEARLETGRTHQIRVHLAAIGHPLVGDRRYGARGRLPPRADASTITALRGFHRQALHAWRLALAHPQGGRELCVEVEPPADMAELIDVLRRDRASHDH